MKKYKIINILIAILLVTMTGIATAGNINLSKTFQNDTILYQFDKNSSISSLKMNATVNLPSVRSLVRVVLGCSDNKEYLVYEAYNPLVDAGSFTISSSCDETELLNNVVPTYIKILINEASITIKSFSFDNNKSSQSIETDRKSSLSLKHKEKFEKLNVNLFSKNKKWRAGTNDFSKMTYMDKKILFGTEKYNSMGLEYYSDGIFEFKDLNPAGKSKQTKMKASVSSTTQSPYIDHFDWREKHDANNPASPYYTGSSNGWVSPIKQQWKNTCWAFAPVGTTETLANLYYNRSINLNLSEHEIISCSDGFVSLSNGGNVVEALKYIMNTGVVDESCFPNPTDSIRKSCSYKCSNPSEKIRIGAYNVPRCSNENEIKNLVLKSPLTFGIWCTYLQHVTVLVGYKVLQVGDVIYHAEQNTGTKNHVIQAGDSLIGRTCWIAKNSWGSNNPTNGYLYFVIDNFDYIDQDFTCTVSGPITSLQYTDNDIKSVDLDGDGYYNWGVGLKPATCPTCASDEEDGDDSNPNLGPMDTYGFCRQLSAPLTYPDMTISSNTAMNTKNILCGNLFITNSATLTISDKLVMPVNSTITISANSKLIVDGGTITYANIIAQSGSELTLQNNAVLQLYKNDELNINLGAVFNNNYGDVQILSSY